MDIRDLSEVAWTCWGVSTPRSGLGLRMVKELDLQLSLGMNERIKNGSLPVYDIMHRLMVHLVRVAPDCNRSYCEDSFSGYSEVDIPAGVFLHPAVGWG